MQLRYQQDEALAPVGGAAVARIEADGDALLAEVLPAGWSADLKRRYRLHRQALFVFLADAAVPPTNNASERSLRPSVVHRKVSGGFRREAGATAYAILRTVADTARKRAQPVFATLLAALDHDGLLRCAEVAGGHVRYVRPGIGGPGAHRVRVHPGKLLDRGGSTAIGVADR